MADRAEYRRGIRVRYDHGRSQGWDCESEDAARREYAQLLAACDDGRHPRVSEVILERRPVVTREMVESRSFAAPAGPGGTAG